MTEIFIRGLQEFFNGYGDFNYSFKYTAWRTGAPIHQPVYQMNATAEHKNQHNMHNN